MTDQPRNITCFYQVTAHILGRLYQQFPEREQLISPKEWFENSPIDSECLARYGPENLRDHSSSRNIYSESLHWLIDEGFLRCEERNGYFRDVGLTSTGLSLLSLRPEQSTRSEKGTYGQIFMETATKIAAGEMTKFTWAAIQEHVPSLIEAIRKVV